MKRVYFVMLLCLCVLTMNAQNKSNNSAKAAVANSSNAVSSTINIVNTSKLMVHYRLFAADVNSCETKYNMSGSIAANSNIIISGSDRTQWQGQIPDGAFRFTSLMGSVSDAAGTCRSEAAAPVGEASCGKKTNTTINAATCQPGSSILKLNWENINGKVTLTIK